MQSVSLLCASAKDPQPRSNLTTFGGILSVMRSGEILPSSASLDVFCEFLGDLWISSCRCTFGTPFDHLPMEPPMVVAMVSTYDGRRGLYPKHVGFLPPRSLFLGFRTLARPTSQAVAIAHLLREGSPSLSRGSNPKPSQAFLKRVNKPVGASHCGPSSWLKSANVGGCVFLEARYGICLVGFKGEPKRKAYWFRILREAYFKGHNTPIGLNKGNYLLLYLLFFVGRVPYFKTRPYIIYPYI